MLVVRSPGYEDDLLHLLDLSQSLHITGNFFTKQNWQNSACWQKLSEKSFLSQFSVAKVTLQLPMSVRTSVHHLKTPTSKNQLFTTITKHHYASSRLFVLLGKYGSLV